MIFKLYFDHPRRNRDSLDPLARTYAACEASDSLRACCSNSDSESDSGDVYDRHGLPSSCTTSARRRLKHCQWQAEETRTSTATRALPGSSVNQKFHEISIWVLSVWFLYGFCMVSVWSPYRPIWLHVDQLLAGWERFQSSPTHISTLLKVRETGWQIGWAV